MFPIKRTIFFSTVTVLKNTVHLIGNIEYRVNIAESTMTMTGKTRYNLLLLDFLRGKTVGFCNNENSTLTLIQLLTYSMFPIKCTVFFSTVTVLKNTVRLIGNIE